MANSRLSRAASLFRRELRIHHSDAMFTTMKSLLAIALLSAAVLAQEAEDDGSYHPEKYEAPYAYQAEQAQAQPQYNPQYQALPQPYPQGLPQGFPQAQPQAFPQAQPQGFPQAQPQQLFQQYQPQLAYKSQPSPINSIPQSATNYAVEGHRRSEDVDPQGNVRGQYSYVDPEGKTITVKYTAGKNGFQVEGDHLPQAPAPGAASQAAPQYQPQAIQQYQPQYQQQAIPQYQQPAIPQYQAQAIPQYQPQLRSAGQAELPSSVQNFFSAPLGQAYAQRQ